MLTVTTIMMTAAYMARPMPDMTAARLLLRCVLALDVLSHAVRVCVCAGRGFEVVAFQHCVACVAPAISFTDTTRWPAYPTSLYAPVPLPCWAAQFSFCNFCGHQVVGVYEETMLR